jgi:glycosyltransferase involved in cell wall biosynthesis
MPSYNQAAYLEDALISVLAQRSSLHEIFVLDGGSSDGSVEIIKRHARSLDFWRSGADRGQAAAIAEGFARATGDVLYWINSDDVLMPETVALVRNAFAEHQDWQVLSGWDVLIDGAGKILRMRRPGRQTLRQARWGIMHVSQPTCFFRRSIYQAVGGIDASLGTVLDTELWCRMLNASPVWGHLPTVLAAFRKHPESKGSRWLDRYRIEREDLGRRHPEIAAPTLAHVCGRLVYRIERTVSGGYAAAFVSTCGVRGKRLLDIKWAA